MCVWLISVCLMIFFVDNPRNDGGIRAETNITAPIAAPTSGEGEGAGDDLPIPPAVEGQAVVEGRRPDPVGEFFFIYCTILIGLK